MTDTPDKIDNDSSMKASVVLESKREESEEHQTLDRLLKSEEDMKNKRMSKRKIEVEL